MSHLIRITESQLHQIVENTLFLITEDIYTSPQTRRAIKYLINNGLSQENAKKVIDALMNDLEIHHSRDPKFKFMLGLSRLYLEHQITDERQISRLKTYLKYASDEGHINTFDENLNGLSINDLGRMFDSVAHSDMDVERDKVNNMHLNGNSDYDIVKIESKEQCEQYGKYTSWCITHGSFNSYKLNTINQCYFCLKHGFAMVQRPSNTSNAPFDEYGLSMISVIVDENGNPKYITTRYNHEYDGENNPELHTASQVSSLLGLNFYEVFKPSNKWTETLTQVMEKLRQDVDIYDIFDRVGQFKEGFVVVELNNKYNYINENREILSKQWFDYAYDFNNGFAIVELNDKCNFINKNGEILSRQWFDDADSFYNGFGRVKLNDKWNFINENGEILSKQWFDYVESFNNGFVKVYLNYEYNYINENGELLSNQWFDYVREFKNGFGTVELNDKFNYINTNGEILSKQWFDIVYSFNNGFGRVKLNDKYNFINEKGKFISKQWFDDAYSFDKGFGMVKLNNEWNYINEKGEITKHIY